MTMLQTCPQFKSGPGNSTSTSQHLESDAWWRKHAPDPFGVQRRSLLKNTNYYKTSKGKRIQTTKIYFLHNEKPGL